MFNLVPFNRKENMNDVEKAFNSLVANFFNNSYHTGDQPSFRTSVKEKENSYVIETELPGIDRENVNIELEGNYLTISAAVNDENKEKEDNYVRQTRRSGTFQRRFNVKNVNKDEIEAEYHEGLLIVNLPKAGTTEKEKRIIDIQ